MKTASPDHIYHSRNWLTAVRALWMIMILVGVEVGAGSGCQMPQREFRPDYDPNQLNDTAYMHHLAAMPVVTVAEGLRGVLLLTEDGHELTTYEARYRSLEDRGAIQSAWKLQANQVLDKGTLAYLLRVVCDLPRSLNERIAARTGLGDRRFALQTCVYEGLQPHAAAHDPVRGGEFLSALTAAENYQARGNGSEP